MNDITPAQSTGPDAQASKLPYVAPALVLHDDWHVMTGFSTPSKTPTG